jgi:hypothetical protein
MTMPAIAIPAAYDGDPLLVRAGRALGLHGVYSPDLDTDQADRGGITTLATLTALPVLPTLVTLPAPAPGSVGPVLVAEVERVRAAARDVRVPADAVLVAERLTRTARQALARLDSLGPARRSGHDAVHAVLASAAIALETFGRLPAGCVDRLVAPSDPGPGIPVWGVVRTVGDELVAQLDVLDRYLTGVIEAINDADVAALTGHGRQVVARFGGEFVPVADPEPVPFVPAQAPARLDVVWLVGLFTAISAIVMAGAR